MKILVFESIFSRGNWFEAEVVESSQPTLRAFLENEYFLEMKQELENDGQPEEFQKFMSDTTKRWQGGIEWAGDNKCSVNDGDETTTHFAVLSDDSVIKFIR